jgi:hypothetical protein
MKINCQCNECRAKRQVSRAAKRLTKPQRGPMSFAERVNAAVERKAEAVAARLAVKDAR